MDITEYNETIKQLVEDIEFWENRLRETNILRYRDVYKYLIYCCEDEIHGINEIMRNH